MSQSREQSESEFADFYYGSYSTLLNALSFLVGSELAEDALAEGYIRAWLRWDRVSTMDRSDAWVLKVAQNWARRRWRRERFRASLEQEWQTRATGREKLSVSDQVVAADLLSRMLSELSPRQQLVFVMRFVMDLPVDEVAATLGLSAGTVKRHSFDLRAKLDGYSGVG